MFILFGLMLFNWQIKMSILVTIPSVFVGNLLKLNSEKTYRQYNDYVEPGFFRQALKAGLLTLTCTFVFSTLAYALFGIKFLDFLSGRPTNPGGNMYGIFGYLALLWPTYFISFLAGMIGFVCLRKLPEHKVIRITCVVLLVCEGFMAIFGKLQWFHH